MLLPFIIHHFRNRILNQTQIFSSLWGHLPVHSLCFHHTNICLLGLLQSTFRESKPVGSLTPTTEAFIFLSPPSPRPTHKSILHEMLVHMGQYFSTLLLFKSLLTHPCPQRIGASPSHKLHRTLLLPVCPGTGRLPILPASLAVRSRKNFSQFQTLEIVFHSLPHQISTSFKILNEITEFAL